VFNTRCQPNTVIALASVPVNNQEHLSATIGFFYNYGDPSDIDADN
jgi:hypothetical protein